MKKLIIMALCLTPALVAAESNAVQERNYRITTSYQSSDSDSTANLIGEVRLPIYGNLGLTLNAGILKNDSKNNTTKSESQYAGLGLFLKKYDLGKIEMRYDYIKTVDNSSNTYADLKTNILQLNGAYYFDRVDISAARKQAKLNNSILNTSELGAAYYVTDNMKLSGGIAKHDNIENENNVSLSVNYQPSYFNNAISTSLTYHNNSISNSGVLSVSYYFDTNVSLLERDRKY